MGTKTWISVAALAVAVALVVTLREDERAPSPGTPSDGAAPAAPAAAQSAGAAAPAVSQPAVPAVTPAPAGPSPLPQPVLRTPEQAGIPLDDCILYPDGTRLPPLNGVKKAPQLSFHRNQPFTRVVGVERDARGREWYVHENGVRSTTYLDARGMVMGEVMKDAPVVPIDPGR
jgi:hypothetical protein